MKPQSTEVQKKKISKKLFLLLTNLQCCVRMITQKNRGSRCYTAPVNRKRYKNGCRTEILHYLYIQEKFRKIRGEIKNGKLPY